MQTLTMHSVKKVILDHITHVTTGEPFFYRYLEVQDEGGNVLQICLYSTSADAIKINEPKGETND